MAEIRTGNQPPYDVKHMNNAKIMDFLTLIQAGINPKNGLPLKMGSDPCQLKDNVKKFLRLIDEQDAVNRYTWYNLPCNLTSQELERMLYYKGQLAFFYLKDLDEFYFMPYALDGTIDFYGRYNTVHPVPMSSGTDDKMAKAQADYLSRIKLKCRYGVNTKEISTSEDIYESCVLLHDYTKQLSQTIISRQVINDPLIDVMSECIPYLRTSLILGTGIKGMRVGDADQSDSVDDAARGMESAALTGKPWIPIVGSTEFQDLTDGSALKSEEFMLAMQSLDNLRLSGYGLENGGLFEKKAHILESENAVNQANVGLVLQDGLSIRQNFCNIVNSIWGLGIWCEMNESAVNADLDGDGVNYDRDDDGSNTGSEGGSDDYSEDDSGI